MPVKHKKTETVPDPSQADLDTRIAAGQYPPGTTLASIVLGSDWNDDHTVNVNLATEATGLLPIANGGTGTATPGLVQGIGVTITGAWPNQTINATGGGTGTVTSVSVVTANGVSGSVATSTTTPAITLTLGAITPSSVAASGTVTGSNLSGSNTGDQTTITGNAGTATALQNGRTIAITGDLTYTSPSFDGTSNVTAASTLATVNSNVGSFGSATQVAAFTVNAKGLITAASNTSIQIAESQVTNLVTDLAAKQPNISLTTTGTGAATFISNVLNIPQTASYTPYAETPSGVINGSNTVYTLANTPANSAGVIVILNRLMQRNGIDYTISGATITFTFAPATNSEIYAQYNTYSSGVGLPFVTVTSSGILVANRITYVNSASLVTLSLPATYNQNDIFQIVGMNTGVFKVAQTTATQIIRLISTSTTLGTGGSIQANNGYNSIVLRGLVANADLSATGPNGSFTVI